MFFQKIFIFFIFFDKFLFFLSNHYTFHLHYSKRLFQLERIIQPPLPLPTSPSLQQRAVRSPADAERLGGERASGSEAPAEPACVSTVATRSGADEINLLKKLC